MGQPSLVQDPPTVARPTVTDRLGHAGEAARRHPFATLAGLSVLVVVALLAITWTTAAVDAGTVWPEVTKALVSVLTVAVLGGIVKFLIDQSTREREERKLETAFLLQAIAEIEGIRSGIEHARFLVASHRSARSYRDQMQNIITLKVRATELSRRLQLHWDMQGRVLASDVEQRFDGICGYLDCLVEEYQQRYKPVSDEQRIDEAFADAQIKRYAEAAAGLQGEDASPAVPQLRWRAWNSLSDPDRFGRLCDFVDLSGSSQYDMLVRPSCRLIVRSLTDELTRVLRLRQVYPPQPSLQGAGESVSATDVGVDRTPPASPQPSVPSGAPASPMARTER